MVRCSVVRFIVIFCLFTRHTWATISTDDDDGRIYFNEENERRWNTPPELTPATKTNHQARFLPFSASFTVNSGPNNGHSLSVGGNNDGISLSQSQSSSASSFGNNAGISTSQSSSFAAGLSGISASNANAFNLNHPAYTSGNSQVNSNSFALGQATSSSYSKVTNNQAITGAQSSVASDANYNWASSVTEALTPIVYDNQGHRRTPHLWTNIRPNYQTHETSRPHKRPFNQQSFDISNSQDNSWQQTHQHEPSLQTSVASAASESSSSSTDGFSFGQSSSQSSWDNGPTSSTNNRVHSFGNAQSTAQGTAAAVGQHSNGRTQASFSSGAISSSSKLNGQSHGNAVSENRGENSWGQVTSQGVGMGNVIGTANAGSAAIVRFPEDNRRQNIPQQFIRRHQLGNNQRTGSRKQQGNPIDRLFTDITDTVVDLFDI